MKLPTPPWLSARNGWQIIRKPRQVYGDSLQKIGMRYLAHLLRRNVMPLSFPNRGALALQPRVPSRPSPPMK